MHDLQRKRHQQIGPARGSRRRFCCKSCRLTYWILKKAAKLLAPLEQVRSWEILLKLSREGQIANSRALVYGPDQSQTAKSSENGENYRRDDICPRTPKRALFPEQDRIQRERRERRKTAEDARREEQAPGLPWITFVREPPDKHTHDERARYVNGECSIGKTRT